MSNIAYILTGKKPALADARYEQRIDQKSHVFEAGLHRTLGIVRRRFIPHHQARQFVAAVNTLERKMHLLSDDELKNNFNQISQNLCKFGLAETHAVAECFAVIREASKRVFKMRHHDVQIIGGWALLQGMIAEMATGEGKTLVATLPACAAVAAGAAVHVVTVNDYLAGRDAETMQPLYDFFGITVGVIREGMEPEERRVMYAKNVCYASNKELVFDYLKDQLAIGRQATDTHYRLKQLVSGSQAKPLLLRGLHMAIVDEVDSVLVDEARTPLIISATVPDDNGETLYKQALQLAGQLLQNQHFLITSEKEIDILPAGLTHLAQLGAVQGGVWAALRWREHYVRQALSAIHLFKQDQHYIVVENKVQIVDEFTGRVMPDRSWEGGLHQMIEAKESCEITGQRETLARMTYQRFFRRYLLLSGMTGTGAELAGEFWQVYELKVMKIPNNKKSARLRLADRCHLSSEARWKAIAQRAKEVADEGRAVLIGTRSVEASEKLSKTLEKHRIEHFVLNARQDKEEAEIVGKAGQIGRITVATNMAGRGTDIHLDSEVNVSGGLHVILAEFNESARIDRQLIGRCARQGDAGSAEAVVSIDDELFVRYAPFFAKVAQLIAKRNAGKISPYFLKQITRYAQWSVGRSHALTRLQSMKQDKKLSEMLAFTGDGD